MLKSFYNPDVQQSLEYQKELLKIAEQERLANQCVQARPPRQKSPQARMSLVEHLRYIFAIKPNHHTFPLKDHK